MTAPARAPESEDARPAPGAALPARTMAPPQGDRESFTVEVWTDDGTELVEIVARSSDTEVSNAAWHAAIRRRPGRLLAHRNCGHLMQRIVAPGEPREARDEPFDVSLSELRNWHRLRAWCLSCSHHAYLETAAMIEQHGRDAMLGAIEKRLRCTACRRKQVRLELHSDTRG